jgi:uncharacterized protein (UPF0548 family)
VPPTAEAAVVTGADWRFLRGWSEEELKAYLVGLARRSINYTAVFEEMTPENGWTIDGTDKVIGTEPTGPPLADGHYARAKQAIINYDFSDPRIVMGHFDPHVPFTGRNMALEIKAFGLHFLTGTRVEGVREESDEKCTVFGFRYDTLTGHFEQGLEWFLLTKDHATGEIRFRIEARWRVGMFPNFWSRWGFLLLGEWFRTLWRHRAPERLRRLAHQPVAKPMAAPGELAHRGDTQPQRTEPLP